MKAGGEVAYNRTTVSLPAMNGRKEGSEGRRRGRGKKFKKKKKKEERTACLKGAWCDSIIAKDSSSTG